mgnify:CR=1 FL=1
MGMYYGYDSEGSCQGLRFFRRPVFCRLFVPSKRALPPSPLATLTQKKTDSGLPAAVC